MLRVAVALLEAPAAGAAAVTVACPPQQLGGMRVRVDGPEPDSRPEPKGAEYLALLICSHVTSSQLVALRPTYSACSLIVAHVAPGMAGAPLPLP